MKFRNTFSFLMIILSACAFLSCDLNSTTTKTGFVTILLSKGTGVKTLVPDYDLEVETFDVVFTRTGSPTIELKNLPGATTATLPVELLAGTWAVNAKAYNLSGEIIGEGTSNAVVQAGKSTNLNLTVSILAGEGTLNLIANWPTIKLLSPTLAGTLQPVTGDAIPVEFVESATPGTYTYSSTTISSGSYTLELLLKDGTDSVSRIVDAVSIIKGATTSGSITFAKDPNFWGNVNATITVDLPSAATFTINPISGTKVKEGISTTITVTPSRPMDSYSWYVNGILQPLATSNTFDTGTELPVWVNVITVIGKAGTTLSSASMNLEVVPDLGE